MVPPDSGGVSRAPPYLGYPWVRSGFRLRGSHPLRRRFPAASPILPGSTARSRDPGEQAPRFGLLRFRSPLLAQSRLISLPQGTEMFHFPWCGSAGLSLFIPRRRPAKAVGFPHSDTPGSKPVDGSPRIVAVFRVLLRLLMPRHPSCARIRLAELHFWILALRNLSRLWPGSLPARSRI